MMNNDQDLTYTLRFSKSTRRERVMFLLFLNMVGSGIVISFYELGIKKKNIAQMFVVCKF
jgi:hypothetical protein